jgi:hypothetical protein
VVLGAVLAASLAPIAGGCASTARARTTRLASADLDQAVLEMRDKLASSRFLADRGPDSPESRLVLRRVENLSTDRIPIAEQWSLASRVISHPGMQQLLRARNVVVQLPPEKVAILERAGLEFPALASEDRPTHVMRATIASGTRAGSLSGGPDADIRKEYYLVTFVIEDLQGRDILWQADVDLAREAGGSIVD